METNNHLKFILGMALLISTLFVVFLIVKSNQIIDNMEVSQTKPVKVLILSGDTLNDQSWGGSLAYKGKLLVEEELNAEVEVIGDVNLSNDLTPIVKEYVENNYQLIIGHGREFSEPFYRIANQFKHTQFVTLHGEYVDKNLAVYTFNQREIEVVAGMAAALKTKTNKIGIIDTHDNDYSDWGGFPQGIKKIDTNIELIYEVVPERTDKSAAKHVTSNMIDNGIDVIYTRGNSYNQEVINFAKEKGGVYLIGYLEDQSYMAENAILTSVLNNIPYVYKTILKDHLKDTNMISEKRILDSNDGVYGLAPFGPMFTQEEITFLNNSKKQLNQ
ncbi:positive regulator of comK [Gracilibacillus boraciitolerans JCM 21714]|uniref:Positive regulator of comK n=1 Tax=Gracilibacillus boraciitolerans JCM 21714 TaxID=1298598 RepID=W4VDM0_9BACI|nr:BMP family ABC transporter substrate-binding protein [Gracilibacillus boraciitolerans]GAE91281.1 positive regulator of comK [Gracilibacillus boraciitolerans JCM 21714]